MAELKQLPKPMQEVVLVASQVRRHRDVGEILEIPETRVGYLLASAGAALGDAAERRAERERPLASPRAARLRELEDAPPEWLVEAVGRPPARGKNASASILAWRRAAPRSRSTTTATTTPGPHRTRVSAPNRPTISPLART